MQSSFPSNLRRTTFISKALTALASTVCVASSHAGESITYYKKDAQFYAWYQIPLSSDGCLYNAGQLDVTENVAVGKGGGGVPMATISGAITDLCQSRSIYYSGVGPVALVKGPSDAYMIANGTVAVQGFVFTSTFEMFPFSESVNLDLRATRVGITKVRNWGTWRSDDQCTLSVATSDSESYAATVTGLLSGSFASVLTPPFSATSFYDGRFNVVKNNVTTVTSKC